MNKRTKRKNNRVSGKRVSRKRVSRKKVSRKKVSRKKNKITSRKFNKMIGGANSRAEEDVMGIYKKIEEKMKTKKLFEMQRNRPAVLQLQREINELERKALDAPPPREAREARARAGRGGQGENPHNAESESIIEMITAKEKQIGALLSFGGKRDDPAVVELQEGIMVLRERLGAISRARHPRPHAMGATSGFTLEKPPKKFSQAPDDVKFVLIPGSSNIWGSDRTDGAAMWQGGVERIVGDSNILKSTHEYNRLGDLHCGKNNNKPRRAALDRDSSGSEEMRLCIANTFENNAAAKKSVIATSQGSALFIDYIVEHPEMLENVHSIVFVSPATIAAGRSGLEFAGPQKTEIFLRLCEQKNKRILLLLTEHGWGRWGRWGEEEEEDCVYDVTDEDTGMEKTILVANCSKIKKSRICDSLIVPGTTHSFDIYGEGGGVTPVPYILCETIIAWCRSPGPDIFDTIKGVVRSTLL